MSEKQDKSKVPVDIKLEGLLRKKSRFLGKWRLRWCVLHGTFLTSYKEKNYKHATETIDLRHFSNLSTQGTTKFRVYREGYGSFSFAATTEDDCLQWLEKLRVILNSLVGNAIHVSTAELVNKRVQFEDKVIEYENFRTPPRTDSDIAQTKQEKVVNLLPKNMLLKEKDIVKALGQHIVNDIRFNYYKWEDRLIIKLDRHGRRLYKAKK
eukprot:UN25709